MKSARDWMIEKNTPPTMMLFIEAIQADARKSAREEAIRECAEACFNHAAKFKDGEGAGNHWTDLAARECGGLILSKLTTNPDEKGKQ
jgi:hypothetical protein